MDKSQISVVLLCKNEAKNLGELLPMLLSFGEVVLVDDGSTDETEMIAEKNKFSIYKHKLNGNYADARNFGLTKATKPWVLYLDCDERLEEVDGGFEALILELERHVNIDEIGIAFKREEVFLNKRLKWGELKDQWIIRLAKNNSIKWEGVVHECWPHEKIIKSEQVMLLHKGEKTVSGLFEKVKGYARIRSREIGEWNIFDNLVYPLGKFVDLVLLKQGWRDGGQGIIMALAMSWHSFLSRYYLINFNIETFFWLTMLPLLWLGSVARIDLGWFRLYPHELALFVMVIRSLITKGIEGVRGGKFKNKTWRRVFGFGIGYLLINGVWGMILGGQIKGLLYVGRLLLYAGVLLELKPPKGFAELLLFGWLVIGYFQLWISPDMRWLYQIGFDDHYYRMVGTIWDPNYLGMLGVIFSLLMLNRRNQFLGLFGFGMGSVLLTWSRASYLALLLSSWHLVGKKAWILLPSLLLIVFIGLNIKGLIGGEGTNLLRTYSVNQRFESAKAAISVFVTHPLFGVGFNQYPSYVTHDSKVKIINPQAPDNLYLWILATTGLVGLGLFGWLIVTWWVNATNFGQAIILAILLHSLFNPTLVQTFILISVVTLNEDMIAGDKNR